MVLPCDITLVSNMYRLMYNDCASKLPFLPPSKQDATHEDSLDLCWWLFSKLLLQKRVALYDAVVLTVRISGKLVWLYETCSCRPLRYFGTLFWDVILGWYYNILGWKSLFSFSTEKKSIIIIDFHSKIASQKCPSVIPFLLIDT